MQRRSLLATVGTGIATAVAGCADDGSESPTPTPTPGPAESELRLSVENTSSTVQDVGFLLRTTRGNSTTVEAFELTDIGPGETRTRDPQELPAGTYELEVELRTLSMRTTSDWAGRDCPVKDIDLELRADGFRFRDACPDTDDQ
ncbi:hypothetical protein [Haloarcula laminariae]|uniref:hypothetical protein n=1 Tax=Haloarcula laminariae TaxID=2961577 RepID=UPI0021C8D829|nr:hypothetical protein [Halomicroarcula laminariae]